MASPVMYNKRIKEIKTHYPVTDYNEQSKAGELWVTEIILVLSEKQILYASSRCRRLVSSLLPSSLGVQILSAICISLIAMLPGDWT